MCKVIKILHSVLWQWKTCDQPHIKLDLQQSAGLCMYTGCIKKKWTDMNLLSISKNSYYLKALIIVWVKVTSHDERAF